MHPIVVTLRHVSNLPLVHVNQVAEIDDDPDSDLRIAPVVLPQGSDRVGCANVNACKDKSEDRPGGGPSRSGRPNRQAGLY